MLTLERELRENIRLHKFAILTKKISQYYMDYYRANNTVFLFPDTLEDCARKKAKYDVRNLYLNNKQKYNELYEIAYKELESELN